MNLQDPHVRKDGKVRGYGLYRFEASKALFVSGVVLVVGFVGMLIMVSLNGWWMDRRIGRRLITLWCCGTIAGLVLEAVEGV